jgi:hypothetical protein
LDCNATFQKKKGVNVMKRFIAIGWFVGVLGLVLVVTGCASYYRVTDTQSGNVYYTNKVDTVKGGGGAVKLEDTRSGSMVTLQNSEVKEISKKEYKEGLAAPVSKAAPAAAPAPKPATAPAAAPAAAPTAPAAEPTGEPSAPSETK